MPIGRSQGPLFGMFGGLLRSAVAAATLLLAFAGSGQAQPHIAPEPAEQSAPAIWRLADTDSEIWLFGTIHVLPPEIEWRTPQLNRIFEDAEVIYFETPSGGESEIKAQALVWQHGMYTNGGRLSDLLSRDERKALRRVAKSVDLDPTGIDNLRPWLAAITLGVQYIIAQGADPNSGVEKVLEAEARELGKELRYFETIEQQIGFFHTLSEPAQKEFLLVSVRQIEEEPELLNSMFAAWLGGDVPGLAALINGGMTELAPEVYDNLILKRNQAWTEEIDTLMAGSGKALIAVGAGHLTGEDSLVEMLRAQGHTVDRLTTPGQ